MLPIVFTVLLATFSIPIYCVPVCENPTICYTDGCIQGKVFQEELYEAYLGIPYAQPPVGNLRFSNPIPVKPWSGLLNATVTKPDCIQKNVLLPNAVASGSEDCLYLNVYRPVNIPATKRLPVMVFIHGGGFFAGSAGPSMVGPQHFMENGEVILVSMAYRLGVFGFLSTGDNHCPGNFGLKDQTLALRWVKSNIRAFGGDDNEITIFGVSAGGAAVQMHMMSPLSQGLFHRGIIMSGSAIAPYNEPTKNPSCQAKKQGRAVGIQYINNKDLITKLRKIDAFKLLDSVDGLKTWSVDPLTYYRPVIESNRSDAFMVQDPRITWRTGQFQHIPFMTGVVVREGAVRASAIVTNQPLLDDLNANLKDLLPKLMEIEMKTKRKSNELFEKLKNFYLNGTDIVNEDNRLGFIDMFSDRAFVYPYYKTVQNYIQYADTERHPVSLYRFAFKGPISYSLAYTGTNIDIGVVHLDDTLYLLGSLFPPFPKNSIYSNLTKTMVSFYVSFAKNGRPMHLSKDAVNECTKFHKGQFCDYQEFSNSDDEIGFEVRTKNNFDCRMVNFWDNILH
ncbi:Juvenile hormone esterase [Pseudolycoriella hygida]|uniref:Carboxylic ester hydrolase n=1 Tax=Pseudolycoriella hygida TaxID=35572 RepID=A0A9Q0RW08_9DIPT|nr:Juvenile hormone esterase [Pseudolycoriella hygida]